MSETPTTSQFEKMLHSLSGSSRKGEWFRNYYADEPDDPDMNALVNMGLMFKGRSIPGGTQYFHVTQAGKEAVRDWLGPKYNPRIMVMDGGVS